MKEERKDLPRRKNPPRIYSSLRVEISPNAFSLHPPLGRAIYLFSLSYFPFFLLSPWDFFPRRGKDIFSWLFPHLSLWALSPFVLGVPFYALSFSWVLLHFTGAEMTYCWVLFLSPRRRKNYLRFWFQLFPSSPLASLHRGSLHFRDGPPPFYALPSPELLPCRPILWLYLLSVLGK